MHEWETCIPVTYRHTPAANFAETSFYFWLAVVSSNFLPLSQNQGLSSLPDSVRRCGSTSSTPRYLTVHRARLFSRFKYYLLDQMPEKALKSAQNYEHSSLPSPLRRNTDGQLWLQWRPPSHFSWTPSASRLLRLWVVTDEIQLVFISPFACQCCFFVVQPY